MTKEWFKTIRDLFNFTTTPELSVTFGEVPIVDLPCNRLPMPSLRRSLACTSLAGLSGLGLLPSCGSAASSAGCDDGFRQRCLSFEPEKLVEQSTRMRVEFVANGTTLQFPDNDASCKRASQKVSADICRIALYIATSNRSGIRFELWLPEKWSDARYVSTGNGGVDGCIKYEDLAYTTSHGFAAMGTNNGHNGTTGVAFLNNPDVIEDFSYRALHTGTVAGKALTEKFYKQRLAHSYYVGCSLGGRMGIKAAELFPEDYDGIVAGCPAVDFNNLQGARAMFYPITGELGSPNFIGPELWTGLIHDEILKQCDQLDGVKDGIIEVPGRCHFRPQTLRCPKWWRKAMTLRKNSKKACLNSQQVEQLEKIYATYKYPNGSLIFPRMNPGNEIMAVQKFFAGAPFSYSQDWFRYVILNSSTWDAATYNTSYAALAEQQNPFNIRTYPLSLPAFKARGGKLLSYHGGQDNQITSFNTERFWDRMASADADLQDWYRFFRISGMFHCSQGPGAWVLGQGGGAAAEGIPFEASKNVLAALVDWVEKGRKPESLTGTKFVDDTVGNGVDFERVHCLYPKTQTYLGGNPEHTSSWRCV